MNQHQNLGSIEGYTHISTVVEKTQRMMDKVRSGQIKPLFTSSKKEKEKVGGYYPGDQVVIAARTGVGKSAKITSDVFDFCDPLVNPVWSQEILVLWDSWEMADWRNVLRMISRQGAVEAKALLDYAQRLQEERFQLLRAIADKFKGLPIYLSTRPMTVFGWYERKKHIQGLFPQKKIVNIFDHTRLALKKDEGKEEELITNLMIKGIDLKNNFEMINFFLSQMNRNIETAVNRDRMGSHTPVASDIFGSDAVFQCADLVMALHRPGMYKQEQFEGLPTGYKADDPDKQDDLLLECILKSRDGWTGNLSMRHNLAHNKIEDYVQLPIGTSMQF